MYALIIAYLHVTLSICLPAPVPGTPVPLYPLQAASLDRLVLPTKLCESGGMNNGFTLVRRIHKHSFINIYFTHLLVQMPNSTPVHLCKCSPVHLYTCTHVHLYTCTHVNCTICTVYTCTHVHLYTCTHVNPANLYTCTPVHLFTCTPENLFTCTPENLLTCTHVHLYTCTPVHLYTRWASPARPPP